MAPFSLTDNRVELLHPPRYDEYDDGFFEQPILCTSSGSDPIYDDYASHSESNEEIDEVLSTSEWGVSYQNVAFLENTHLILDMINKEHEQVFVSSFHNDPRNKGSSQEKPEVKEETPHSPSTHVRDHTHLSQTPSPFLGKESGQIITNFCEGDVEIEEEEQRASCLKEFVIAPQVHEERKLSYVSCPPPFDKQQGVPALVFQDPFSILLETLEGEVMKACLILTNVYDLLDMTSFQAEVHFRLASLLSRVCFLSKKKYLLISQSVKKMLTWLHWIFDFS